MISSLSRPRMDLFRSGEESLARSFPVAEAGQGSLLGEDVRRVASALPSGHLSSARIEDGIRPGLCQAEAFALIAELIGEAHAISLRGSTFPSSST